MSKRLLEELKQTRPFPHPQGAALVAVLRTAAVLEHELDRLLKPLGLTRTQFNVLRILRGAGAAGLCGREVGERLVAKVPDVPRLLERMEQAGLIGRERDAGDRRNVTARITARGRKLLDDADGVLEPMALRRFGGTSGRVLQQLMEALDEVRARE